MDITVFLAVPGLVAMGYCAFLAGQASKEYPSEEDMLRRIKAIRLERKLRAAVDAEVEKEIAP